ncbi:MAG: TOMM precursor leader peptide-binding protein [Corynebacterium sp.]|uniref:TOMM precursor leader peptide-binding protein n=1 Tax=Corynebacterium sp. TaxID=1720 RepID=UPI0026DDAA83|nr:TOMM precursor leader peptide-binding protein [Corynebacterium sp.]MDO5099892.1 TOMM precursor leader peptide-binding protein [Corynebacterium sp.]
MQTIETNSKMLKAFQKNKEILYLAADEFGAKVSEELARTWAGTVIKIENGTHPNNWPWADLIVLVIGYERPHIAETVEQVAYRWNVPWFPIIARPTEIQIGPIIKPKITPCYSCVERRRRQHGTAHSADQGIPQGLSRAYSILEIQIALVAAISNWELYNLCNHSGDSSERANARLLDLVTGTLTSHPVIGIDQCKRCGGRFGEKIENQNKLWQSLMSSIENHSLENTIVNKSTDTG